MIGLLGAHSHTAELLYILYNKTFHLLIMDARKQRHFLIAILRLHYQLQGASHHQR
jgi:hypothetical protein